jgi:ankyrin repeat protein
VRLLLENGADIEVKDEYGANALYMAASNGREATVRLRHEKDAVSRESRHVPTCGTLA